MLLLSLRSASCTGTKSKIIVKSLHMDTDPYQKQVYICTLINSISVDESPQVNHMDDTSGYNVMRHVFFLTNIHYL